MGSTKSIRMDSVVHDIWQWAIERNLVPVWPNQPGYGAFLKIVIKNVLISPREDLQQLPQNTTKHPLRSHSGLLGTIVCGKL